ncbi:MAG: RING-HC finger protein [Asgard group archaeon]|nr:RING-HC finger protein [Asgard group archaeon]
MSNRHYYQHHHKVSLPSHFINVNFKFIVDQIRQEDPNIPIDTEDIIRVIGRGSCPICLTDEPIAPRMIASCGHIVCLKCILALLESAAESSATAYCPICLSVIPKHKHNFIPVLINYMDENVKIGDDVTLQLMCRRLDQMFALPYDIAKQNHAKFPGMDIFPYLRVYKGDLKYALDLYELEKAQILQQYDEEKLIYGDDYKLVAEALCYIDKEMDKWKQKFSVEPSNHNVPSMSQHQQNSHDFYFFQTAFNNNTTIYTLNTFDMKVLKSNYHSYSNLPTTVTAKIESIRYDELTPETVRGKFKYLGHLPVGTQVAFLEIKWNNSQFINHETWEMFKEDLIKRSKKTKKRFNKEERDRKRAMDEEERRNRDFFKRENSNGGDEDDEDGGLNFGMGSLRIVDLRELPALSEQPSIADTEGEFQTTIWGTRIPKTQNDPVANADNEYDLETAEMIRKAKEEMAKQEQGGNKKKKKKKLVLLSS